MPLAAIEDIRLEAFQKFLLTAIGRPRRYTTPGQGNRFVKLSATIDGFCPKNRSFAAGIIPSVGEP